MALAAFVDRDSDSRHCLSAFVNGLGDGADSGSGDGLGGGSVASTNLLFLFAKPDLVNVNFEDDLLDRLADIGSLDDGDGLGRWFAAAALEREDIGLGIDDIGVCAVDGVELITVAGVDVTWDLDVGFALGGVQVFRKGVSERWP